MTKKYKYFHICKCKYFVIAAHNGVYLTKPPFAAG